ncbi:MAG: Alr0786 protein [uncultured Caballeronia sp.]|nr:MAG: Alr0786 protein [uncultured Caballeronia sp.]
MLIVPTGVGAEIGGHDGDAGPVAMLLSSICDRLITHPNVVNAADINELPANGLYVEGSVICRLLLGQIGLEPVRANRVLAVVGSNECPTFVNAAINSVNAARAAYGLDCPHVLHLDPGIRLTSTYASSGRAAGVVENLDALMALLAEHRGTFDAVAIASHIHVPDECRTDYYGGTLGMVNPWGGVEAMLTHTHTHTHTPYRRCSRCRRRIRQCTKTRDSPCEITALSIRASRRKSFRSRSCSAFSRA